MDTSDATAIAEDIAWGETAYVKGEKITGTKVITVAHGKESQKVFEENTNLIDDYGNRVKVPMGFKIASDSATMVTGGVVIEDISANGTNSSTTGSQFVWIPIGNVKKDSSESIINITLGRYKFADSGEETLVQSTENWKDTSYMVTIDNCKELVSSSRGNATSKDLEEFINRTKASGGYYIGRYEAGDLNATNSPRTGNDWVSNLNNPVTCKAGVYPYTYISQADASKLCKEMYNNLDFESDLVNSYAWDTAIVFIENFSGDISYSKRNCVKGTIKKCDNAYWGIENDIRCNIYNMVGNTHEWTTETSVIDETNACGRGGSCNNSNEYTAFRSNSFFNFSSAYRSCRPILYL